MVVMQNMIARLRRREGTGGTTYHAEYCWERQEEWRRNGGKKRQGREMEGENVSHYRRVGR